MAPYNNYHIIKDQWPQITITDIIIIKKLEVWQELPKCDKTHRVSALVLENETGRLAQSSVAINFQFVKKTASVKHNKATSQRRYAYINLRETVSKHGHDYEILWVHGTWDIHTLLHSFAKDIPTTLSTMLYSKGTSKAFSIFPSTFQPLLPTLEHQL